MLSKIFCIFISFLAIALSGAESKNAAQAGEKSAQKACFACNGSGKEKCNHATCDKGQVNCPAPCLKSNVGKWEHMNVAGHKPDELWQKFHYSSGGKSGYKAWNQNHIGEIIEQKPGQEPVNKGKCPTCQGKTRVKCEKCAGTGMLVCAMCKGSKSVPSSWTATDNPVIDADPNYIKLKDGRVIRGKIVIEMGNTVVIKPDNGKNIETTKDQIVPKTAVSKASDAAAGK